MANKNYNGCMKAINETGVQAQVLTGKNSYNVIAVLVQGYKFDSLANFNSQDFMDLFQSIKCEGVESAYNAHTYGRNSSAKQKVNDAHGRSYRESAVNHMVQDMTYADRFSGVQFKRNLYDVLVMYCKLDVDAELFPSFRDYDYKDFAKSYININYGKNCKGLNIQDIKDNYIIVDNKVFAINNLVEVVNQWIKENGLQDVSREEKVKAIRGFETVRA